MSAASVARTSTRKVAAVRTQLSEKEISDLTFVIMAVNAWHHLILGSRRFPVRPKFGLDKAALN